MSGLTITTTEDSGMELKDRVQLAMWLRTGATLAEVECATSTGVVGNTRYTNSAVRAYRLIWTWAAPRFGGEAGKAQDKLYERCGRDSLARRMARARELAERITAKKL